MEAFDFKGKKYELIWNNRLRHLEDWTEEIGQQLAAQEGLHLTHEHWRIIHLMRCYYAEYNISPIMKLLKKTITNKLGKEDAREEYLDSLFPGGVLNQGTRIAGLPLPYLDAELDQNTAEYLTEFRQKESAKGKQPIHFVGQFQFDGNNYHVTKHGNLVEQHAWTEHMAEFIAMKEKLQLTEDHWEIIHFLRQFYFEYGITPMVRLLMKHMRQVMGREKSSEEYIYKLFPGGPSRQGSRIAGLPEPQGCVD